MSRDISVLHPRLQAKITQFLYKCNANGYSVKVTECLRTVKEQDELYAKGRTTAGSIVTNAKGTDYKSMHQWGVAFDICRNDGKGAYYNKDGWFSKVGAIGKKCGLEWGGSWTSIVDLPHFQLSDWGSGPSKLKNRYGRPIDFFLSWKDYSGKYKVETASALRTLPSITSKKLAVIPKGTRISLNGEYDIVNGAIWVQCTWEKNTGFIRYKNLTKL